MSGNVTQVSEHIYLDSLLGLDLSDYEDSLGPYIKIVGDRVNK